jgi:pre-mRNA-splicing factor 18
MDLLKAEISRKRKLAADLAAAVAGDSQAPIQSELKIGTTKYIRQSDAKKMELERIRNAQMQRDMEKKSVVEKSAENNLEDKDVKNHSQDRNPLDDLSKLTVDEIKSRLRKLLQPITLFGESNEERVGRLLILQSEDASDEEYRLTASGHATEDNGGNTQLGEGNKIDSSAKRGAGEIENDYDDFDDDDNEKEVDQHGTVSSDSGRYPGTIITNFARTAGLTPEKIVYKYFKNLNKMWEWDLNSRDNAEKLTAKGKMETRTQKQCKDYIRPLFKLCRKGEVPLDILNKLVMVSMKRIYVLKILLLHLTF